MSPEITEESWESLHSAVAARDFQALRLLLDTLSPAEVARGLSRLTDEDIEVLLTMLTPEDAAGLLEELTDAQSVGLLDELPARHVAAILDEMSSDHRADLLSELEAPEAEAILSHMDPEEAADLRVLLTYPPDTAGGIMVTEYLSYDMDERISTVFEDLRSHTEEYSDYGVQYAYVTNKKKHLVGVLPLRSLLLTKGDVQLAKAMIPNPVHVNVTTPLEEVVQVFDRYDFMGVPVVDDLGRLAGVVRRGDAEEAFGERADRALMQFGGIVGGEELRSMPVFYRAFKRLSWLSANLVLSVAAASVIAAFEGTIERLVALAFFIPIIGNMSGCSANQAVAVSIRELSVGLIEPRDMFRVVWKELQVGLINGLILGAALAVLGLFRMHTPLLGLAVGGALAMNTLFALSIGGLIPLILRRFGIDAALAAPPMVQSLSDMCGFFLVLSLATAALG
jgi:magnesium transporter